MPDEHFTPEALLQTAKILLGTPVTDSGDRVIGEVIAAKIESGDLVCSIVLDEIGKTA